MYKKHSETNKAVNAQIKYAHATSGKPEDSSSIEDESGMLVKLGMSITTIRKNI